MQPTTPHTTHDLASVEDIVPFDGPSLSYQDIDTCDQVWVRAVFPIFLSPIKQEGRDEGTRLPFYGRQATDLRSEASPELSSYEFILDALVINRASGDVYISDDEHRVWKKCRKGLVMSPVIQTARAVAAVSKATFSVVKAGIQRLAGKRSYQGSLQKAGASIRRAGRAVTLGWRMEKALWSGLSNPFDGRAEFGRLERAFNEQEQGADFKTAYYSAKCFQPISCVRDPDWLRKVQEFLHRSGQYELALNSGKLSWCEQQSMIYGFIPWKTVAAKHDIAIEAFAPQPQQED